MTELRIKTQENKLELWQNITPIILTSDTQAYLIVMSLISPDATNVYEVRVGLINGNGQYYQGAAW